MPRSLWLGANVCTHLSTPFFRLFVSVILWGAPFVPTRCVPNERLFANSETCASPFAAQAKSDNPTTSAKMTDSALGS